MSGLNYSNVCPMTAHTRPHVQNATEMYFYAAACDSDI